MDFPYLPENKAILFVKEENEFLLKAKEFALTFSLDQAHPTGAIVVKNGRILGLGCNGSDFHEKNGCERKKQNIPTGTRYELCEGCDPKNHAEQKAIQDARQRDVDNLKNADLYLWGHWWCCESCWEKMIEAKIGNVYLQENARELFEKK